MSRLHSDFSRRDFLKTASAATLAVLATPRAYSISEIAKTLAKPRATADTVIVLWMAGGMAHTETFDRKRIDRLRLGWLRILF